MGSQQLSESKKRVCQSHCCLAHGCKYGRPDCPVRAREVVQDHPCEECGDEIARVPDSTEVVVKRSELLKLMLDLRHSAAQVTELQMEMTMKEEHLRAHRRVALTKEQSEGLAADLAETTARVKKSHSEIKKDKA
jgi:hypothetical protein